MGLVVTASGIRVEADQDATGRSTPDASASSSTFRRWIRSGRDAFAAGGWALGQFFRTGTWTGETHVGLDLDSRRNDAAGGSLELRRQASEGGVSIRNSGLVFGPRWAVANVGLDLALRREAFDTAGRSSSGSGRVVGYDLGMTARPDRAFSFGAFAARDRNVLPMLFGAAREHRMDRRGAQIRFVAPMLDSTLRWARTRFESEAAIGSGQSRDGDERTTLSYTGTRRTDRQNILIEHRREEREDLLLPELSFPMYLTRLRYGLVLDPNVSRRTFAASLGQTRRGGDLDRDHLRADARLDFRVRPTLDTRTTYRVERVETDALRRERQTADFQLQHRLYESLLSTVGVRGAREDFQPGTRRLYGFNLLAEYRKKIPAKGLLSVTAGHRLDREIDRLGEREDMVFGEGHDARLAAPFRLDRPRVLPESIVITDAAEQIVYREGTDYTVGGFGEFVEIGIVPGGRIVDGQALLVDYRFLTLPIARTSVSRSRLEVSVDYGWINPYFRSDDSGRELLEGAADGNLFDRTSRAAGVRFRFGEDRLRFYSRNEYRSETAPSLDLRSIHLGQTLSYRFREGRVVTLNAEESLLAFETPVRRESRGWTTADYAWQVNPGLSLRVVGNATWRRDGLGFSERFQQAGLDVRWRHETVHLSTHVYQDWGSRDGRRFEGLRLGVRLSRPF